MRDEGWYWCWDLEFNEWDVCYVENGHVHRMYHDTCQEGDVLIGPRIPEPGPPRLVADAPAVEYDEYELRLLEPDP